MIKEDVDEYVKALNNLTVIEKAYAYHTYMLFVDAAKMREKIAPDLIFRIAPEQIAALPLGAKRM